MARQILRWVGITLTSDDERFTWDSSSEPSATDLGTEDESQAIPTFSNTPLVKVYARGDRRLVAIQTSNPTTGFTVKIGSEGDDNLPITFDVEVVNRDSESVTGPTPSTDFSSSVLEPMTTPLDIVREHRAVGVPCVETMEDLLDRSIKARRLIDWLSKLYSESSMQTTPWNGRFFPASIWEDKKDLYSNYEQSVAFDAVNRAGLRAITLSSVSANIFTQMYTITFTSSTAFSIEGQIEGSVGSGNTSTDFTSGNGDFSISSDAWYGSFGATDKFYFAIYRWYPTILRVATSLATASILWPRYGRDNGEGALSTAGGYFKEVRDAVKALMNPDSKDGMRLPSLGARDLSPKAMPYDVDFLGRDMTKVVSSNEDSDGNRGEIGGIWNISTIDDLLSW